MLFEWRRRAAPVTVLLEPARRTQAGEAGTIVFGFKSLVCGQLRREELMLVDSPVTAILGRSLPPPPSADQQLAAAAAAPPPNAASHYGASDDGTLSSAEVLEPSGVMLHGAAQTAGVREHLRAKVHGGLESKAERQLAEDVLLACVRDVKMPRRKETVRTAQRAEFEAANAERELTFTAARYNAFEALFHDAHAVAAAISEMPLPETEASAATAAAARFDKNGEPLPDVVIEATADAAEAAAAKAAAAAEAEVATEAAVQPSDPPARRCLAASSRSSSSSRRR